ncbi:MAG: class I adenylate-forming enzyme family protein [Bacilli bacterium]
MFENMSIYQAFLEGVKLGKNKTALYYQGKKISFNKLSALVDKYAAILKYELNVKEKDVVLIALPNMPLTIILYYAVSKIGAVSNLVHPFTPYNQMREIMEKTNVKVSFLFEQRIAKEFDKYKEIVNENIYVCRVEDHLPLVKKFFYHYFLNFRIRKKLKKQWKFPGFKYAYKLHSKHKNVETSIHDTNSLAVLLHSGSTTGDPKTICLSDWNFNFLAAHAKEYLDLETKDIIGTGMLAVLPSFHGFGLEWTMHAPLSNGFASLLIPKFSVKATLDVLKHNKVLAMCGVPTMYEKLLNDEKFQKCKDLKHLKVAFCGGDAMPITLQNRFNKILEDNGSNGKLYEGYGLTESIAAFVVNTPRHYRQGSIGYPGSGVEMGIFDENRNKLGPNELGEIAVKSPSNMIGYFNDIDATKACTQDGWLFTGDLGYLDEDNYLYFKQRIKRVVKVSGVAVFPTEIEHLIESIPGVDAVCAVSIPDKKLLSAIKVFVVSKAVDKEGMKQIIMDTCRKYLIRWSVPKEIEFRKELPTTLLGKIDFKVLQKEEDEKRKNNE